MELTPEEQGRVLRLIDFLRDNNQLHQETISSILSWQIRERMHPVDALAKLRDATYHLFGASASLHDEESFVFHLNVAKESLRKAGQDTIQVATERYLKEFDEKQTWYQDRKSVV